MDATPTYDCIIIGAGPGGLQAAIHLARYNRKVLLLDRGGGRTSHARHIVNYLGIAGITGRELIAAGLVQTEGFGVTFLKATVRRVSRENSFVVVTSDDRRFRAPYVIVSSGASDIQPRLKNLARFFGRGFYTCVDCDGHHTTGKQLLIMADNLNGARLALGMRQMYTAHITLLLDDFELPGDYEAALIEEGTAVLRGKPVELLGENRLVGVRLSDGRDLACEAVMASYGWRLHDEFLRDLALERDAEGFKVLANRVGETSVPGLYVVGALRPGHSQAIIAAGQGAVAAIDINASLLAV